MGTLKVFEGMEVDIIIENDEPLFEIYSTGMALGQCVIAKGRVYPNKERINNNIRNAEISPVLRNAKQYINEEQLYDLMLETRTEKCKPFRKWVTSEVLPSIRKTGSYNSKTDPFDLLPPFVRRYVINAENVPNGHFSMISQVLMDFVAPLQKKGYILPENLEPVHCLLLPPLQHMFQPFKSLFPRRAYGLCVVKISLKGENPTLQSCHKKTVNRFLLPDGSIGKGFSQHLRKLGYPVDSYPSYSHSYEDGRIVQARAYPDEIFHLFRHYLLKVWLPEKSHGYFEKRDLKALEYLPPRLTTNDGDMQLKLSV